MPTVHEKMLAEWANKPVIEPPGFFERLANAASDTAKDLAVDGMLASVLPDSYTDRMAENITNYATGAVQGAQEVLRQGNALAETNPLALTGTPMEAGYTNAPAPPETNDQQFTRGMYKKATGQFNEGTVKPAFAGFSLLAPQLAAPYYMPVVASILRENVDKADKQGKQGAAAAGDVALGTAKDLFAPAAYEYWNAEGSAERRKENPGAFAADLTLYALSDAADLLVGGTTARKATRNTPLSILAPETERNALATANNIIRQQTIENGVGRDQRAIQGMLSNQNTASAASANEAKVTITPEIKIQRDEQNFAANVDALMNNELKRTDTVKVMDTPAVMTLVDAELLPVEISVDNLNKVLTGKHKNEMSPETVKQLPRALTDPVMILDTYDGPNGEKRRIAVLELTDNNGNTVVAPFELKKKLTHYEINELKSVYGKNEKNSTAFNKKFFEEKIKNGEVLYVNNKKADAWAQSYGLRREPKRQDPKSGSFSNKIIPNEADLAKRLKELNTNGKVQYSLPRLRNPFKRNDKADKGYVKPITVKEVEKAFNAIVPVRHGGVDKKYEGLFKVQPEVVRVRGFKEYQTYGHELGHYLDKQFAIQGHDAELIRNAESVWGNNPAFKEYTPAKKRAEGIAEFTAELLQDPSTAKRNFPGYFNDFKRALQQTENKKLAEKLDVLGDALYRYINQSPQAKARAGISYTDDVNLATKKERFETKLEETYRLIVDDKDPIRRFVDEAVKLSKENVDYENNPYLLARSAASSAAARSAMLLEDKGNPLEIINTLNKVYNNSLKHAVTLQDIFKDVDAVKIPKDILEMNGYKDNRQAFSAYLVAKRQLELQSHNPNYKGSMKKETAQVVVNEAPEGFVKAAEKVYQHFDNVLSILEDGGLISSDMHKTLSEKYNYYVPMYRDMEMAEKVKGRIFARRSNFGNIPERVKKIEEGADWNVIDPLETLIKNTQESIDAAEKNKAAQALVKMKDIEGIGRFLEERPDLKGKAAPDDNVFTVWENGEKKSYQVTPELYDAMTEFSLPVWNTYLKEVLVAPADIMRTGATGTPAFGLFNFARDVFTAGLYSRNTKIPVIEPFANSLYGLGVGLKNQIIVDFYNKFAEAIKSDKRMSESELAREFKAAGVPMTTRIKAERASLKWQRLRETPFIKQAGWIYDFFVKLNSVLEEAPRMGEFAAARRKGKSIEEAGFDAREVTMDFGRGGFVSKTINKGVPFFNVTLQSADRLIREIKTNPVRLTSRIATYIAMPALVEWLLFNNEDWYEDMPNDVKDNNLIMRFGDEIVRTPIPQELAFLNGGIKRMLSQYQNNDPDAMNNWADETLNTFLPDIIPAFLKPILEWKSQYNFFTGQSVVPKNLQNLPDKEQYNIYTSMAAVKIGEALNLSPIKIDNLIRNIGATGATTINASVGDFVLGRENELPAKNLNEAPVIGRFGYTPGKRSQNIDDFYKLYEETSKDVNAYDKEAANYKNWKGLQNSMKKVRKLNQKRQAVLNNKQLTAREKRTQMDELQRQIIDIAKTANEKYRKPEE